MKRNLNNKHARMTSSKYKDLKKPFGFCCDINHQDPETQYDMRNPPFESVFPETPWDTTRPDIKFRLQDIAKAAAPPPRVGIYREDVEIKKAATYGRSKKGRGPLIWFLEDEIEAARDLVANEKKARREEIEIRRAIKRTSVKERRKSSKLSTEDGDESQKIPGKKLDSMGEDKG